MEFVITEIKQFSVLADTKDSALTEERMLLNTQTIVNERSKIPPNSVKPVPIDDWPTGMRILLKLSTPEDKGMGDVIARVVGRIGGNHFKVWYKSVFGKDCGCDLRQEFYNIRYPLK